MSPALVKLRVVSGPKEGDELVFDVHDTCLVGRDQLCRMRLPEDDEAASGFHLMIEANPPRVRLRDLGTKDGTWVNAVRHGGRQPPPAPGARTSDAMTVELSDGDLIEIGATKLAVAVALRPGDDSATWIAGGPAEAPPTIPTMTIGRRVGDGARRTYLGTTAAGEAVMVKSMRPVVPTSEATRAAFLRQTRALRKIRHPYVVGIRDDGWDGQQFYFVTDHFPQGNLLDEMSRDGGRIPVPKATRLLDEMLHGMAHMHRKHVVHRGLEPSNVLIDSAGRAIIGDFGLLKEFDLAGMSGCTMTGARIDNLDFIAKEQVVHFRDVDPRTDVWAIAATFFYMLTGRPPRTNTGRFDARYLVLAQPAEPIRRAVPVLSQAVGDIIDRALAADLEARFADAEEMKVALRSALDP